VKRRGERLKTIDLINHVYFWGSWAMVWSILISRLVYSQLRNQTVIHFLFIKSLGAVFIASLLMFNDFQQTWVPPYFFDWLWTTPFTLLILWALANRQWTYSSPHGRGLRMQLLLATIAMLAFGMIAERVETLSRGVSFLLAALCLVFILVRVWGVLYREAQHQTREQYRLFLWTATFVSVAWLIFPLLWLLGPLAFNWIAETMFVSALATSHLLTKFSFFLLVYFGIRWQERDAS
jgi:bacteriorhodopsin